MAGEAAPVGNVTPIPVGRTSVEGGAALVTNVTSIPVGRTKVRPWPDVSAVARANTGSPLRRRRFEHRAQAQKAPVSCPVAGPHCT